MKKPTIVAAVLGLAMTGCAHTRKAGAPEKPIGMEPIPEIHETINRGASPAVARATLPEPNNPNWEGRSIPAGVPPRAAAPNVATTASAAGAAAVLTPGAPPAPFPALAPEVAPRQASAPPQFAASDPQVSPSSISQPTDYQPIAPLPPGGVVESPSLPPVADDLGMPASPPASGAPGMPDLSKPLEIEPYAPPLAADPAAAPSTKLPAPAEPTSTAPSRPASAASDPLLGPNPELMPSSLEGLVSPEVHDPGLDAPTPAPAPVPAPPVEPSDPALAPAPAPAIETSSLPELSPSPVSGGGLEPASAPGRDSTLTLTSATPATAPERPAAPRSAARVDPAVRQASAVEAVPDEIESAINPHWQRAGETAARVGDEVITMLELTNGVKDQLKKHGVQASQVPRDEINTLAQNVLANLIDRSLICQAARHELKDKKLTDLIEVADKYWGETELPPLLRMNMVTTEQQLRLKMEEAGRSLEALKLSHRQDFIAMLYIQQKLKDKLNVELPEMLKYYNAHVNDQSNFRAARITWREIIVETAKHPSPADAKLKAESLLTRLQRGEDFVKLAKAESEGPSAVKAQGGLMETSPGGYAVPAVNQAIETLQLGAVGGVIEGPSSFHIVRVEQRRAAGPASFAELQDQIRNAIYTEKSTRERRQLLDKLHASNVVASIFDGTDSDPNKVKR